MKLLKNCISRPLFGGLLFALIGSAVSAQVQVSNFGNTTASSLSVYYTDAANSNRWANSFTTDNFSYSLNSVTLNFVNSGNDFYAQLFSNAAGAPGSLLASFGGLATVPLGNYSFTPTTAVTLAPNTTYWFVTGQTGGGNASFQATTQTAQTGSWTIGDLATMSTGGGAWTTSGNASGYIGQFSVNAAGGAIPEPSTYAALAGLGVLGFSAYRKRRGQVG